MPDLLTQLVEYLEVHGIVEGDGVDTFREFMPNKPDKVIVLYEYAGLGTILQAEGATRRVQVTVRSSVNDLPWARDKCWEIFNTLDTPEKIIDGREELPVVDLWGVFVGLQTPFRVRVDESNRPVYGFNLSITTHREIV